MKKREGSRRAADAALAPAIRMARRTPNSYGKLAKVLTRKTGDLYERQAVHQWLHPDPEKRVEPKLGIGLLLIRAAGAKDPTRKA